MGGEAVAQTVSRQRLVDVSGGERLSKYLPHGIGTDMSLLGRSWKEPFFGSTLAPVLAQKFQQALREDRVALAVALSEHVNEHALGVDIRRPQLASFGDAQSSAIHGHQHGSVFHVRHRSSRALTSVPLMTCGKRGGFRRNGNGST